jgi:hypothetical protein
MIVNAIEAQATTKYNNACAYAVAVIILAGDDKWIQHLIEREHIPPFINLLARYCRRGPWKYVLQGIDALLRYGETRMVNDVNPMVTLINMRCCIKFIQQARDHCHRTPESGSDRAEYCDTDYDSEDDRDANDFRAANDVREDVDGGDDDDDDDGDHLSDHINDDVIISAQDAEGDVVDYSDGNGSYVDDIESTSSSDDIDSRICSDGDDVTDADHCCDDYPTLNKYFATASNSIDVL